MVRSLGVVLALVLTTGACRSAPEALRLDGSPRVPDDEGVATSVSRDEITLDGRRTYEVSDELRAFSTSTLELEPMIGRRGQYVQIGLDGETVTWMAGVARIITVDGVPSVFYVGTFEEVDDGRFVFEDGTTFAPGEGLDPPPPGATVTVRIDVRAHRIVGVQ